MEEEVGVSLGGLDLVEEGVGDSTGGSEEEEEDSLGGLEEEEEEEDSLGGLEEEEEGRAGEVMVGIPQLSAVTVSVTVVTLGLRLR